MIAVLFDVHAWIGNDNARLEGLDLSSYVQHVRSEFLGRTLPCARSSFCSWYALVLRARQPLALTCHEIIQP